MIALNKNTSNKSLIEACSQGDKDAISIFYERYKDLIYSAIHKWISKYSHGDGRHEQEDDVKEVFNEAIIYIMDNNFRNVRKARDPERISGLIFLLAYQVTGKYFKKKWIDNKRKGENEPTFPDGGDGITEKLSKEEGIRLVGEFLKTLSDEEQDIMELFFGEGLKYKEIAYRKELSTTHVGVIISRIKNRCRVFIQKRYGAKHEI